MSDSEIADILDTFARWPCSFGFDELLDFVDPAVSQEAALSILINDSRFILVSSDPSREARFIPTRGLFRWFCSFTQRLAQIHQVQVSEKRLAHSMTSVLHSDLPATPPPRIVDFGQSFGFLSPSWTHDEYFFPLAHIFSFIAPSLAKAATQRLETLVFLKRKELTLKELAHLLLQEYFSQFSERVTYVVQARGGLLSDGKMTLEQIAVRLGVTRERVRQIEQGFWNRSGVNSTILTALLCDVMSRNGSLIITVDSADFALSSLLAKGSGIPRAKLPLAGLEILGMMPEDDAVFESLARLPVKITTEVVSNHLESKIGIRLSADDLAVVAERLAKPRARGLNKAQKVRVALQTIGRPAHYSDIARVYHSLFPDDQTSEHNIHAVLSRGQHGVAWIGVKGTFALREWGYERPSKTLFESVAQIVQERYEKTGRPVPFLVIAAEIGKWRSVVRHSSLNIAAHCNPLLQRVSKDSFIPKVSSNEGREEGSREELDKILRAFENLEKSRIEE